MKRPTYLFDMDGVLIDNCRFHSLSWLELARRHDGRLTEEQIVAWMGSPGRDYIARMFDGPMSPERADELLKEKEALYRDMYRPFLTAREGVVAFLEQATSAGIPMAIATGGSRANVDFVLDGLGLRRHFAFVVDASQYARGKPAPDCYLQTAGLLGARPEDCVVFEDAVNGIEAAHAGGIPVVAITGTNTRQTLVSAGADRVIDSFGELLGETSPLS